MSNQSQTGRARCRAGRCAVGLAAMIAVCGQRVTVGQNTSASQTTDVRAPFFDPSVLDSDIPSPLSVVGFEVGRHAVRYDPLVRYLHALADASPAVTLTPYAESHEDRTLYYLTITSPANHARLAQIKEANALLADPRRGSTAELDAAIVEGSMPAVAWLAYSIHGDELSSTDAAMQVAYRIAAGTDDEMRRLREELVIHIDPLMNPDGRERYLGQIEQLSGKVANPDHQAMQHRGLWSAGRGNHYLFDLNRDWLMQVHPETRGRAAAILSWNPHLVVDSHEMGELDTYLFDPPREPLNVQLSDQMMEWRRRFSADQAAAFDRHGWSYYTREWYEEWYAGYTNAWASLLGAVGLLYEQAAVNADSIKQANGRTLTYREAVHHHVVSSLANLETLRANRQRIMQDYASDRRRSVSGEGANGGVFLLPPPPDRSKLLRFVDLLRAQGIEVSVASAAFDAHRVVDIWGTTVETKSFRSGTLVVGSSQPHRRLLHSILEFDPRMSDGFLADERVELENRRQSKLYDVTAWNLAMAYGLEASWADRVGGLDTAPFARPSNDEPTFNGDAASYGYLIDGADSTIHRAIVRLFDAGCQPRVGSEFFVIAERAYQPGAVLLRRHENPDDLPRILRDIAADTGVRIHVTDTALSSEGPDLGGQRFHLLQRPRVAIASQWPVSSTSFGNVWYALDARLGLRSSPINVQSLRTIDLRKYNVLVLPEVWSGETLGRVLDEKGVKNLKSWIESGGTLIAMGRAAAFVADKDRGLSSVRLKRHVLDELSVYAESVEREKAARDVAIDSAVVWGEGVGQTATGDSQEGKEADIEALKRDDEWNRLFKASGAIVAASLASDHWLCFGLSDRLPLLVSGGFAYMSRHPVVTPVRLMDEGRLRLSGLMWPEARERWADTAYATVESLGKGQIILFANDPFFRGYFEGSLRLMLNAIVLGPGMGTSPPLPW